MTTATETLQAAVDALGLTYTAEFVPFSRSRNAKKATRLSDYSLNWKVTISKGSRSLTADYMQGIAHIPGYAAQRRVTNEVWESIQHACENGKAGGKDGSVFRNIGAKPIPAPALHDVLHCLVLDSSVLDAANFEEWAQDFGYETDSRKAEQTYRECMHTALQLRALIGDAGIKALQEAGQDY